MTPPETEGFAVRVRWQRSGLLDPGVALGALGVAVVLVVGQPAHSGPAIVGLGPATSATGSWLFAALAVLAALTALVFRGRRPLGALLVVAAAIVVCPLPLLLLGAALVALYGVAASRGLPATATGASAVVVAVVLQRPVWDVHGGSFPVVLVGIVAAAAFGLYIGVRRVSAVERTEFERRQHALVAERATAEDRVRIARELHDVVAHTLSLIIVQSEVLRTKVSDAGQGAAAAAIAGLGRDAMGELHRTLELLRGEGERGERAPQPVLADLDRLADQSREGGLAVELHVEGPARPLPASVELCTYRIVQEALTNVRRHAEAEHAAVHLRYGWAALEVSIEDDGTSVTTDADSNGHGLRGMRERAAMLGGAVSAGPLDRGGYRVSATLPYPEEP